jgi:hypothetical protein
MRPPPRRWAATNATKDTPFDEVWQRLRDAQPGAEEDGEQGAISVATASEWRGGY